MVETQTLQNGEQNCDELLELIQSELEAVESIYADEGVIKQPAEIVTIPKYILEP